MERPRILIAGVGNIFLGDDAFGVEVVQRLAQRPQRQGVCVVDFGIRGLDLTYALLDGYETVVLVDATPRGGKPGTIYVLEPEVGAAPNGADLMIEGHNMDPVRVLRLAVAMEAQVDRLLLVGCEPTPLDEADEMHMEMSEPVRAAVGEAVLLIESLAAKFLGGAEEAVTEAAGEK